MKMLKDVLDKIRNNVNTYANCTCIPKGQTQQCLTCQSAIDAATDRANLLKICDGLQAMMKEFTEKFKSQLHTVVESLTDMHIDLEKLMAIYAELPAGQWKILDSRKGPHAIECINNTAQHIVCRFQLKYHTPDKTPAQSAEMRRSYAEFIVMSFNLFPKLYELAEMCEKLQKSVDEIADILDSSEPVNIMLEKTKNVVNSLRTANSVNHLGQIVEDIK